MKNFPIPYYLILLLLFGGSFLSCERVTESPPEVAVVMYEYKALTEVIINSKVFTISDYN